MNISIIGTGYVGLVSGTCFADMGHQVICVDNNQEKLAKLQTGNLPIFEPGLEQLFNKNIENSRLTFQSDLKSAVLKSEVTFLCLPTPQDEDGSADLSYVLNVAEDIAQILSEFDLLTPRIIVNKSTVPVGTAKKVKNILVKHKVKNCHVVSNPEFLREGFAVSDFMKPDRIVIGSQNKFALDKMTKLYSPFVRQGNPIITMDNESAEVTKYAANAYLAMRISYMNELANFCESVNADIDYVRQGMSTDNRIGKRFLFPGIGYGGSCFPKDVNALLKTSVDSGNELQLIKTANGVNQKQKSVLSEKIINHFAGDITEKHFAVWGLAFKPNTDDMREAPSIQIINTLLKNGATITAYDPAASDTARYHFGDNIKYAKDQLSALNDADALLVLTEWNEFRNPNYKELSNRLNSKLIFDGRNVFATTEMKDKGFTYFSIGRNAVLTSEEKVSVTHIKESA